MIALRFRDQLPNAVREEMDSLVSLIRGFLSVGHDEEGNNVTRPRGFDFVPIGLIAPYAGVTAPDGWLLCDGTQVSRVTYAGLFAVVGTTYGAGDGSTTFNLPDFRQRFPLGKAAAGTGATLGETGGAIDHTHPGGSHTHAISSDGAHDHDGATVSGGSHTHTFSGLTGLKNTVNTCEDGATKLIADVDHEHPFSGTTDADGAHTHAIDSGGAHDHSGATGVATGSTGDANPPFLAVNYIIQAGL